MKALKKATALILASVCLIAAAIPALADSELPAEASEPPTNGTVATPEAEPPQEILTETVEDVPVTNMATGDEATVNVQIVSDADTTSTDEFNEIVEDLESTKTVEESPVLLMALGASGGGKTVYLYNEGGVSYGGYGTRKYRATIDGKTTYAYCLEPPKVGPADGNYQASPTTNALLAIALYYMMGGPAYGQPVTTKSGRTFQHGLAGNISSTGAGTDDEYALSHCILSYIYAGEAAFAGIDSIQSVVAGVRAWAEQLQDFPDPPSGYTAYTIATSGQTMGFAGELVPDGYVKLTKSSSNTGISKDNRQYSLEGAVYGVYSDNACTKSVGTLTTKADGSTNALQVEAGTYYLKEKTASKGYLLDTAVHSVKVSTENTESSPAVVKVKEVPASDSLFIDLRKMDSDGRDVEAVADIAQGNASLAGAEFRIDYYDATSASGTAKKSWTFISNADGVIDLTEISFLADGSKDTSFYTDASGKITYPLGTYVVTETKAPDGYKPISEALTGHVTLNGQKASFAWDSSSSGKVINRSDKYEGLGNSVFRGGVKIRKIDSDYEDTFPQGDASLAGAAFAIINKSPNPVVVSGKACNTDETVLTITTNEDGIARSEADALPYGSYEIHEVEPSTGYLLNNEWTQSFSITEDGEMADLTAEPCDERVIRGGIAIEKRDKELDKNEALGGATLEGIEFTITNASKARVFVNGESFEEGAVITKLHTDAEGKASLESNALPYGTYTIRETGTNETYLLTDGEPRTFTIREDGKVVSVDAEKNDLIFRNQVVRNDIRFNKISDTSNARMAGIPFLITQLSTGEQHVVVTDRNGTYNSQSQRNPHSRDTNGNDHVLEGYIPDEEAANKTDPAKAPSVIKAADLNDKAGLWFGLGQKDSRAEVDDALGAFPYGEYRLQELRCENNEGYDLLDITFYVEKNSSVETPIDLGTLTDDKVIPKIETRAEDTGTGSHTGRLAAKATIKDHVTYSGLIPGKTYTMKGSLMVKPEKDETAQPLKINGKPVTSELTFTPSKASGEVVLCFEINSTLLSGRTVVAFESLEYEGREIASHADINDVGQSVHYPAVPPTLVTPTPTNPSPTLQTPGLSVQTARSQPVKTGDASMPILWTGLMTAAAAAGIYLGKKRRK